MSPAKHCPGRLLPNRKHDFPLFHQLHLSPTMPRNALSRLFTSSICTSCRTKIRHNQLPLHKTFSSVARSAAEQFTPRRPRSSSGLADLYKSVQKDVPDTKHRLLSESLVDIAPTAAKAPRSTIRDRTTGYSRYLEGIVPQGSYGGAPLERIIGPPAEPHHFHIYCTKHNTHITLTRPNREPILSFSSGNIGFRKAQRGSYDAGFQLAAYVMKMIQDRGLLRMPTAVAVQDERTIKGKGQEKAIQRLEVVVRGFGKGREAVVKALMGNEGRGLRNRVVKISDATRLKFGGTRSPNPRRLG
jgi:small subunit ribosomal protein S11